MKTERQQRIERQQKSRDSDERVLLSSMEPLLSSLEPLEIDG